MFTLSTCQCQSIQYIFNEGEGRKKMHNKPCNKIKKIKEMIFSKMFPLHMT